MKIKDWIIIGLLVSVFFALVVGRGKTPEKEDASSTIQDMNIDGLMRKIEDASSTLQDMNIDELMRKRVEERLRQAIITGGFEIGDLNIEEMAEMFTEWSRGFHESEWGVEFRAGGSDRSHRKQYLPTSMTQKGSISIYEVLCRLEEKTDMEFIIEPEGVILCREWDK